MTLKILARTAFLTSLLLLEVAQAQVTTFGGDPDRFKGDGDLEPPLCDLNIPTTATAPFFITWSCSDNNSPNDDLRSEVWIKAKGETIPKKVADFFGFPASVQVTEGLLNSLKSVAADSTSSSTSDSITEVSTFSSLLPIEIKLLVRDRGGASAISKVIIVQSESSSNTDTTELSSCDLSISTPATEATDSTVGSASLSAEVSDLTVTSSSGVITASNIFSFSNCEIDELCKDDLLFSLVTNESTNSFSLLSGNTSIVQSSLTASSGNIYTGTSSTTESGDLNISLTCK